MIPLSNNGECVVCHAPLTTVYGNIVGIGWGRFNVCYGCHLIYDFCKERRTPRPAILIQLDFKGAARHARGKGKRKCGSKKLRR